MFNDSDDREVLEPTAIDRDEQLMTAREVAEFLRVDENTLANLRGRGDGLPWTKVTGKVLYKMSDVLRIANGEARGFRSARLATAVETFPGLTPKQRQELLKHITEHLKS